MEHFINGHCQNQEKSGGILKGMYIKSSALQKIQSA